MNYQTVPALLPATFNPTTQVEILDINGDTISEVVVLNPDAGQLAVIDQFTFNDLSSSYWPDAMTPQWWCQWTTPPSPPPAALGGKTWNVQTGDVMIPGDFDGDGTIELFLYNTTTLAWAVLKWQPATNGLATIWAGSGCPGWKPQTGDTFQLFPGPNGAPADGLLAFNTVTFTIGVLQFESGTMTCPIATTGGEIDGWQFHGNDQFYAGHFTNASTGGFLLFNPGDTNIAYLTWNGSAITVTQGAVYLFPLCEQPDVAVVLQSVRGRHRLDERSLSAWEPRHCERRPAVRIRSVEQDPADCFPERIPAGVLAPQVGSAEGTWQLSPRVMCMRRKISSDGAAARC